MKFHNEVRGACTLSAYSGWLCAQPWDPFNNDICSLWSARPNSDLGMCGCTCTQGHLRIRYDELQVRSERLVLVTSSSSLSLACDLSVCRLQDVETRISIFDCYRSFHLPQIYLRASAKQHNIRSCSLDLLRIRHRDTVLGQHRKRLE